MIKKNSVVSLAYTLKNATGEELDVSDKQDPFIYLHGSGQTVPGFETNLEGMRIGERKDFQLSPDQAYGEVNDSLRITVGRDNFPKEVELEVGQRFAADAGDGREVVFEIAAIKGDKVSLDGNHPLAGQTLHFSVEVLAVREATGEELSHGHAHGPDGHHHH